MDNRWYNAAVFFLQQNEDFLIQITLDKVADLSTAHIEGEWRLMQLLSSYRALITKVLHYCRLCILLNSAQLSNERCLPAVKFLPQLIHICQLVIYNSKSASTLQNHRITSVSSHPQVWLETFKISGNGCFNRALWLYMYRPMSLLFVCISIVFFVCIYCNFLHFPVCNLLYVHIWMLPRYSKIASQLAYACYFCINHWMCLHIMLSKKTLQLSVDW